MDGMDANGLLTDGEKLTLFKRRSARWGSKAEPGDEGWKPEVPRLLRRTVELLVSANVLPSESIPRLLGLSSTDVEKLFALRENYFKTPGEVLELATLRRDQVQRTANSAPMELGKVMSFSRFKK